MCNFGLFCIYQNFNTLEQEDELKISLKVEGLPPQSIEEPQATFNERRQSDDSQRSRQTSSGSRRPSESQALGEGNREPLNEIHVSSVNQSIVVGSRNQSDQQQAKCIQPLDQTDQSQPKSVQSRDSSSDQSKVKIAALNNQIDQSKVRLSQSGDTTQAKTKTRELSETDSKTSSKFKESTILTSESKDIIKKKSSKSRDNQEKDIFEVKSEKHGKNDNSNSNDNNSNSETQKQTSEPLVISTELLSAADGLPGTSGSSNGTSGVGSSGQARSEDKSVFSSSFDSLGKRFL